MNNDIVLALSLLAVILPLSYFLYNRGIGFVNMKLALMEISSMDGFSSRFSRCSGYMKRVIRFKQDRIYRFSLDLALSKGDVCIELVAPDNTVVLRLDKEHPVLSAELSSSKKYRLVFRFRSASGSYKLSYD